MAIHTQIATVVSFIQLNELELQNSPMINMAAQDSNPGFLGDVPNDTAVRHCPVLANSLSAS